MARRAQAAKSATLFFTLIGFATAQAPTGSIAGVVHDRSGASVSAARVKAVRAASGITRTIATAAQGDFSFPALAGGAYELSVEVPGFQRSVREAAVEVGATTTVDFTMSVGDTKDSVTVEG